MGMKLALCQSILPCAFNIQFSACKQEDTVKSKGLSVHLIFFILHNIVYLIIWEALFQWDYSYLEYFAFPPLPPQTEYGVAQSTSQRSLSLLVSQVHSLHVALYHPVSFEEQHIFQVPKQFRPHAHN